MYKILGVGKSQPGKVREAIAASKGLAEYMNSKHDVKVQVHLQQFGPPGTIYLIGEAKDLASIQAIQGKIMADEGYWTLVQKSVEVMEPPPRLHSCSNSDARRVRV